MRYLLDACNLIFASHKLEETLERHGFQPARAMLVGMLERFVRAEGLEQAIAVFDGSEKGAHRPRRSTEAHGKVVLIYASPRIDADRAIIEMVEDAKRPGEFTVVTNDKFIIKHVLGAGAHHVTCRDFLRRMSRAKKKAADPLGGEDPRKFSTGLTANEIDFWMKYFGLEE
jgi:predicted RNA-binding protein with PIN domain